VHKTRKSTLTYNDYNSAIRFKPDFALAYNNRGEVMADLGDNQEAIKDYNLAIRLNKFRDAFPVLAKQGGVRNGRVLRF
jgi:tetratricopeptide (TPR) repeat protein